MLSRADLQVGELPHRHMDRFRFRDARRGICMKEQAVIGNEPRLRRF